ncbi:PLxRFG domain-containing protein [Variovorax sp. PDNC026]|uniref:PLxRFG domain-containing protein n=1 Tax=Variovorax sp. PDNC026 TaxID=2811425 RepID=UPI001F05FAC4|nr:PLxRFG domain-containing protein [Variovorax sp. PDNC026]
MVMDAPDAQTAAVLLRDHLAQLASDQPDRSTLLMNTANGIIDRADKVRDLQARGYAPLSRFGRYTVDVVDAKGERQYFGLFETAREANTMAASMRSEFGDAAVSQGTLSEEAFKMFAGVTPETLELFGNALGLDATGDRAQDQAFQEYLKLTKTNRSAMRRLIHRKGIAGFSEDVGRVLASFIYSNSRQTAAGLNMGDLGEAVNGIPKEQGELKDVAVRLAEYVKNPQEEAQAVRGLLFAQYLGGSIASAFVNMTQPAAVTFPWLSQYGGARKAAAALGTAAKNMATRGFQYEPDLAKALKTAEEEGVVSPQEVHQLMAQARGSGSLRAGDGTRLGEARAAGQNALARLSLAWGKVFGAAEQVNRRITFIAAYRVARDRGEADPAAFASRAVKETQFVYSKASKMQWGRGAVGGTMMCVDDTTEALTTNGWKTVDELREGDLIASFDMSEEKLVWKKVQMVFQKKKKGEMIHVKDRNLDMFMTPDHRVVTYREERIPGQRTKFHRRLQIQEAQNLTSKDCIPVAAPFHHEPVGDPLPDALVRVIGWVVTEGYFVKKNRGRQEWGGHLRIGQNEGPKADRIREDLKAAGLPWVEHKWRYEAGNAEHIYFNIKKSACSELRKLLPEKVLTPSLLMRMTTAQIRDLVRVMLVADGHTDPRGKQCFIQNPGTTLDSFQMALTMLGIAFSVHQHGAAARKVVLKDAKWYTLSRTRGQRVPFEGRVWCPIVADTHTWVARRGGRVFITHNTFKTYSIAYLELLHRMYTQGGPEGKRAALLALGTLMMMGGSGGLPFAEDIEDAVDGLAQLLGYNFSAKKARQEALEAMLPKGIADFLDKGVSGLPGAPLDVSGRLGMGNLIPGTGLLQQKTNHTRDVLEIAGPAGDFASRIFSGALNVAKGNLGAGALEIAPTAVRNAAKGVDMAATGMYRDAKGYKVLDTNTLEAALKSIGFQPNSVATIQEANGINQGAKAFYNLRAQEIRATWAQGIFEGDQQKVQEARDQVAAWNRKNPEQPMLVRIPDVMRRVREMRKSKDERIADTAPRAMRAQMREDVARARASDS